METNNKNIIFYFLGLLTVLAGILYIIDPSIFDFKGKKERKLSNQDADAIRNDWENLQGDFLNSRSKLLEEYGV